MNVEIANNLVKLRKKNGLSQEALAEKIGVSRQAVSKWERAESSPDTDNLIALSKLYGISLDEMLSGSFEKTNGSESAKEEDEKKEDRVPFIKLFPYPVLVVIIYLFIGIVWDLWSPGWLLFLTIPLWAAAVKYFSKKKKSNKS